MNDDTTILGNEATLHHGLALGTELPDTVRLDHALRACGAYQDLGDHWKARALDAESKVDGQAWDDLVAERDKLRADLTSAEDELERYNVDLERAESALAKIALEVSTPLRGVTEDLSPDEIYERLRWRLEDLAYERDAMRSQGRTTGQVQMIPMDQYQQLIAVVEAAKAWRANLGTLWTGREDSAMPQRALVVAVDALNRGNPDLRLTTEAEADEQAAESRR